MWNLWQRSNKLLINKLLFFCGLFCSQLLSAQTACIIEEKNGKSLVQEGDCYKRYSPCSTFKIAISLMGFDSGVLVGEKCPNWDYKNEYVDWLGKWKQPHDPIMWFANSCVWYSQKITKQIGIQHFIEYVKKLEYGNGDISGDKGQNNGLTKSWLSSSLAISPIEQVEFMKKLVSGELAVSKKAQEMTKNIMFVEDIQEGWKLYGKTGCGFQLNDDSSKTDRQIGWFVGFASKENNIITFAYLIEDDDKQDRYASLRAKLALKDKLTKFLTIID
jgi:beta-lactamase class D